MPCERHQLQTRRLPCAVSKDAQEMAGTDVLMLEDVVCLNCDETFPLGAPAVIDRDVEDEILAARIAADADLLISSEMFDMPRARHRIVSKLAVEHGWRIAGFERMVNVKWATSLPSELDCRDHDIGWLAREIYEDQVAGRAERAA